MVDEAKGVTENSPSPLAEAIASTPEVTQELQQAQETQNPTAEQGDTQEQAQQQDEVSRVPYSRLKEVVDEKNSYKQMLENLIQRQQSQQPVQQPQADPYAGMTLEEKNFWEQVDRRAEVRAKQIVQTELQQVNPVLEAGRQEIAIMKVQQFRQAHPDIKPNSPEEMEIAQRIHQGYHPEDAYRIIMFDKVKAGTVTQVKQQVKQQINNKKMANVETSSSVPVNAQPQPKMSFREKMLQNIKLAEEGKL